MNIIIRSSILNNQDGMEGMVSATFNNISIIKWGTVCWLLMEDTGLPGENHRPAAIH